VLIINGFFENGVFIPEKPLADIKGRQKAVLSIDDSVKDEKQEHISASRKHNFSPLTMAKIEEWAKTPELLALVGVLKGAGLPANISMNDIRNERLTEKHKL